jgi:hypothetical protein
MPRISLDRWYIDHIVSSFGTTITVPESQRVWSWNGPTGKTKMVNLIDSVMKSYAIPNCILFRTGLNTFEVYDGQHRFKTFQMYANDEFAWDGRRYSELTTEEKRRFESVEIPVTIISDATITDLVEMFIRMNQGAPLKDYDMYWANRQKSFVQATERLIVNNARLAACLSLTEKEMKSRKDLSNWVGLLNGITTADAGNITTSYIRVCNENGLDRIVDDNAVNADLNALCELLETANGRYPKTDDKKEQKKMKTEMQKLKKVGKLIAYFFHDWFTSNRDRKIIVKWVFIIEKLRSDSKEEREAMQGALSTSGAQNLNANKVKKVLDQVNDYLKNNTKYTVAEDDSDDESQ